jgi:HTH-type transcriptional regulator, competence development regulator
MNFANNLKRYRIKRGLSQKELADRFNVSPSSITMYETGQREPNFTLLDKMATFFDVTTDDLLGRNVTLEPSKDDSELLLIVDRIKEMQLELEILTKKIDSKLHS